MRLVRISIVGFLLFIPVFFQALFQFTNLELPMADGGDHFRISYLLYNAFSEGIMHGIYFFFHTGGKPILFSIFPAPLIYFAKYDVLLSIRLSLILMQILAVLAYYWLFTTRMRPVTAALLACVLTTTPYIFQMSIRFMPEVIWHCWFVLFLAALYRSNHLTNKKLTILSGVFLALTILARPVESVILVLPALALYSYYLYLEKKVRSLSALLLSILLAGMPIVICSFFSFAPRYFYIGLLSIIAALYFLYTRDKRMRLSENSLKSGPSNTSQIEIFLMPFTIICSVWLLFYAKPILYWGYDNSFGHGAKTNDQVNLSKGILRIFWEVIQAYGELSIIVLFVLMMTSLLFIIRGSFKKSAIYFILAAVAVSILPMLFAYSFTGTSDMRRIFLGMDFLLIVMCFLTFPKKEMPIIFEGFFTLTLVALLAIQLVSITAAMNKQPSLTNFISRLVGIVGPLNYGSPSLQKSEDATVIREIKSLGVSNARIAVFSLGMFSERPLFQAESLRYVTLSIDKSLIFGTMWAYTNYEPYDAVLNRLRFNGYDYVVLEDLDNPITDPALRKRLQSHTFFVHDLLAAIKKHGANHLPGLALIKKFKIEDRFVYLFKVYNPDAPKKITASSQLADYGPADLINVKDPGWHAASPPTYPQVIHIELQKQRVINTVGLLAQTGNLARAPKKVQIKVSVDGHSWHTAGMSEDSCTVNTPDGWHDIKLLGSVQIRFLEITILSNCGSPDFLTLKGLRIK